MVNTNEASAVSILGFSVDNSGLFFVTEWSSSTWKSTDIGSNFGIYKGGVALDKLNFVYDSAVGLGDTVTWNIGMSMDTLGNVGVGTASPTKRLVVRTATNKADEVVIMWERSDGLVQGALGVLKDGDNNVFLGSVTNHPLYLQTNNLTKMTILAAGNVGIGTTSPQQTLNVVGNLNVSGSLSVNSYISSASIINKIMNSAGVFTVRNS